jgi:uncharacterized protein
LQPEFFDSIVMNIIWFDHLLFILVGVVLPILSISAEKPGVEGEASDEMVLSNAGLPDKKHIYYSNGLFLIIGALIVLTLWNVTFRSFEILGISYPVIDMMVIGLCVAIVVIYFIDTAVNFFKHIKSKDTISSDLETIMPTSWNDYLHFIFMAFAAGICEEIVFRGFMINYVLHMMPSSEARLLVAMVLPALIFSISHVYQGWFSVLKIFAVSLLFSAIFLFSKSLVLVCIIHVLIDLISGAAMVLAYKKRNA